MPPIGLVANPASGKDVRRISARASVFDNQEKTAMLRRALAGIRAFGDCAIRYLPDLHHVCKQAVDAVGINAEPLPIAVAARAEDTTRAARELVGAAAVLVLGGDGTNRAFAKGWLNAPLISLSTGTNNAFPQMREATTAGAAAALLAAGGFPLPSVAAQAKAIHVEVEGEVSDLALIDAVLTSDRFVGARALDRPERLKLAVLTQADPAGVGMTSVGGFVSPLAGNEDAALQLDFRADSPQTVLAALAPGRFEHIGVAGARRLSLGEPVVASGPGVLAFDGERERVLQPGQTATLRVLRDGPWVVDVAKVLACRARSSFAPPNSRIVAEQPAASRRARSSPASAEPLLAAELDSAAKSYATQGS